MPRFKWPTHCRWLRRRGISLVRILRLPSWSPNQLEGNWNKLETKPNRILRRGICSCPIGDNLICHQEAKWWAPRQCRWEEAPSSSGLSNSRDRLEEPISIGAIGPILPRGEAVLPAGCRHASRGHHRWASRIKWVFLSRAFAEVLCRCLCSRCSKFSRCSRCSLARCSSRCKDCKSNRWGLSLFGSQITMLSNWAWMNLHLLVLRNRGRF